MKAEIAGDVGVERCAAAACCRGALIAALAVLVAAAPARAQGLGGLAAPPGGIVAGKSVRALVLEQVKRAPSGKDGDAAMVATRQLLISDLDGQRLYMAEFDTDARITQHIQVRLDGDDSRVYTLTPDGSLYKEHSGDLNNLQQERDIAESNEIELGRRLPRREREKYFEKHCHLRPDGKRIIDFSLSAGAKLLDRACEHLVVKENCLTIIDAQVTDAIPGARNYYHLYRRLGAFSEEVLERLRDLDGVPLKAKINVVTALKTWPLEVETKRMEVRQVPVEFFELPPNAKEIVEDEGPGKCPQCGKEFERELASTYVEGGRKILLCSDECNVQYALGRIQKAGRKPAPISPKSSGIPQKPAVPR